MDKRGFLKAMALGAATALAQTGTRAAGLPTRVAAASDLKFALARLVEQYRRETGHAVEVSLGSSGQFAQQIRQGLPVDLYMAADESFVRQLAQAGLTRDDGDLYAIGRIAAVVPASSKVPLDPELGGLRGAWTSVQHFAIANPEHAPYGRAAREALQRLGLWDLVQPRLVVGENIAQATQFVTSGAAQAGISALSLALAPEVARLARHVVLPGHLHQPLRQRMVLLRQARPEALDFYRYLRSAPAREILRSSGFDLPG